RKQFTAAKNSRDGLSVEGMHEVDDHRDQRHDSGAGDALIQGKHKNTIDRVHRKVGQPEPRRPPFPDRIVNGLRKYDERAINACVLLLSPIWRSEKLNRTNRANNRIGTYNRTVVENEIIWQRVNIAERD